MSKSGKSSDSPPKKKVKLDTGSSSASINSTLDKIADKRQKCAAVITRFKFNKNRCKLLSKSLEIGENGGGVLYWMSRDQRVQGYSNIFFLNLALCCIFILFLFLR